MADFGDMQLIGMIQIEYRMSWTFHVWREMHWLETEIEVVIPECRGYVNEIILTARPYLARLFGKAPTLSMMCQGIRGSGQIVGGDMWCCSENRIR